MRLRISFLFCICVAVSFASTKSFAECGFVERRINDIHYAGWALASTLWGVSSADPRRRCRELGQATLVRGVPSQDGERLVTQGTSQIRHWRTDGSLRTFAYVVQYSSGADGNRVETLGEPVFSQQIYSNPAENLRCRIRCTDSGFDLAIPVDESGYTLRMTSSGCYLNDTRESVVGLAFYRETRNDTQNANQRGNLGEIVVVANTLVDSQVYRSYTALLHTTADSHFPAGYNFRGMSIQCERGFAQRP